MAERRHRIEWQVPEGTLAAVEPGPDEIAAAAGPLAVAYNDPGNAPMMGHDEPFSAAEVVDHFEMLQAEGGRPFLLFRDGELAGDADLRGIGDGRAELALLIAAPSAQGRGLGTRFALMVHAFAFRILGLERLYVAIRPENQASLRLFARLGYQVDESPVARAHVDDPSEVTMSLDRPELERRHGAALAAIRVTER